VQLCTAMGLDFRAHCLLECESAAASGADLITCYPFYFIGAAPTRFIVHAVCDSDGL